MNYENFRPLVRFRVAQRASRHAKMHSAATTATHVKVWAKERADLVEDRLITLIDGGENLADWYPRPRFVGVSGKQGRVAC
jgi:hypothetical protein